MTKATTIIFNDDKDGIVSTAKCVLDILTTSYLFYRDKDMDCLKTATLYHLVENTAVVSRMSDQGGWHYWFEFADGSKMIIADEGKKEYMTLFEFYGKCSKQHSKFKFSRDKGEHMRIPREVFEFYNRFKKAAEEID